MILGQRQMKLNYLKKNEQAPDFGRPVHVQIAVRDDSHILISLFQTEVPQSANSCIWENDNRVRASIGHLNHISDIQTTNVH